MEVSRLVFVPGSGRIRRVGDIWQVLRVDLADSNVNNSSQQQEDDPRPAPGPSQPSAGHGFAVPSRPVPYAFGPPPYSCSPLDKPAALPGYPTGVPGSAPPGTPGPVVYPPYVPYPIYYSPPLPKGLAIASLVLGVGGLPVLGVFGSIAGVLAVIFGAIALKKCRNGTGSGRGMAIAGIITGAVTVLFSASMIVFMIVMFSSMP